MEKFVATCLLEKDVDIYCGGPDIFHGKILRCVDGILTLETANEGETYIAAEKIIAIWIKK